MAVEKRVEQGNLIVFEITGELGIDEFRNIHNELDSLVQQVGHIKILTLLKDFTGWQSAQGWEQISTDHIDPYIIKMALVGDEKWRDLAEVFTLKGLRPVPIQYFSEGQEAEARNWLDSD